MSQLCRLCLSESYESTHLSEYREGLPISVLAMIILPIKIYDGEDFSLPQKVCCSCLEIILNAYKLRDVSLSSEKILKSSMDESEMRIKNEAQDNDTIFFEDSIFTPEPRPAQKKSPKNKRGSKNSRSSNSRLEFNASEEADEHLLDEQPMTYNPTFCGNYEDGMYVDCYRKDKTPKTSMVWRYFGKLYSSNDKHINPNFHYCSICIDRKILTRYKTTTATSCLFFHLENAHGVSKDDSVIEKPVVKEKLTQKTQRLTTTGSAATVCSVCGKSFGSHHIMKKHMKIHSGMYYPCDSCPAKFSYIENLYRHKRCHDPNHLSRYVCDMCGNRFAEMKSMKNHIMRVHLNILPPKKFPCTVDGCSYKFAAAFNLKKHMLTHTDLKPHECQFCSNAYASKGDLVKHLQKNHVGDSIYHCEHCSESFRFKIQLREHYKIHYQNMTKEERSEDFDCY